MGSSWTREACYQRREPQGCHMSTGFPFHCCHCEPPGDRTRGHWSSLRSALTPTGAWGQPSPPSHHPKRTTPSPQLSPNQREGALGIQNDGSGDVKGSPSP